jgi:hypothetical protein
MPDNQPPSIDPEQILNSRRIGAAITTIGDPASRDGPVVHLDETERDSIRRGLQRVHHHPLVGFAQGVLDQWEDLNDDDRTAGLLLFAELIKTRGRERRRTQGLER